MKRYIAVATIALAFAGTPCHAQFLQKLGDTLLGGQQQGLIPGQQYQQSLVGNVNLPPGQYMMTNVQSGQAFYVSVQSGQMFLSGQPNASQLPGQGFLGQQQGGLFPQQQQGGLFPLQQQGGMGGLIKNGLGNFLQNQLAPQQQTGVGGQFGQ